MRTICDEILERESVNIFFQPIVFVKKQCFIGYEALARTSYPDGKPMSPLVLFEMAHSEGKTLAMDRLCRKKAMDTFAKYRSRLGSDSLLFINFESSIIDQGVCGSGAIIAAAQKSGLGPENIVIEINESKVHDVASLELFVETHRKKGFLIAIDDLGTGESNLIRVPRLRPHIIKLDIELIRNLDKDFFKQQTVKSIALLSRQIGAILLAEGAETEGEVDAALDLGVELVQGYYFSKPQPPDAEIFGSAIRSLINDSKDRLRHRALQRLSKRKSDAERHRRIVDWAIDTLNGCPLEEFQEFLKNMIEKNDFIECAYVIDNAGSQCTATIFSCNRKAPRSRLFVPANRGTDHSAKEYFYSCIDGGLERYTTEPYVSLASGSLCITLSRFFSNRSGEKFVLCLDITTA